jgi:GNAT superfamily N-acetyltransferase
VTADAQPVAGGSERDVTPDADRSPDVTLDRVGPGGGVASDSAFGVALVTLWQRVAESGAPVGFPVPVVRSEVAARAAALVDGVKTGRVLAVAANRARRLIAAGFLRPGSGTQQHTGRLELLLVDPANTRTGLGTRLTEHLLHTARDRGLERIEVAIADGAGLQEFFGRFGFVEWGRKPQWIGAGTADRRDELILGAVL